MQIKTSLLARFFVLPSHCFDNDQNQAIGPHLTWSFHSRLMYTSRHTPQKVSNVVFIVGQRTNGAPQMGVKHGQPSELDGTSKKSIHNKCVTLRRDEAKNMVNFVARPNWRPRANIVIALICSFSTTRKINGNKSANLLVDYIWPHRVCVCCMFWWLSSRWWWWWRPLERTSFNPPLPQSCRNKSVALRIVGFAPHMNLSFTIASRADFVVQQQNNRAKAMSLCRARINVQWTRMVKCLDGKSQCLRLPIEHQCCLFIVFNVSRNQQ